MEDPHLKDVGFFEKIEHPTEGKIWNMKLPNKLSRGARTDFRHAPKIGEQSLEVLQEAGLSEPEIAALLANGATLDGRPKKS